MIKLIEKYPIPSLLLYIIIMLGFTIDAIPISIMEARNFISAREMLTDNNWVLTTMNGDARYEKPPLPTWITAVFGYVFGMKSLLAIRWPVLLFVASIGISSYLLSLKLNLTKSHSLINGFLTITSFYVIGIIIEAPWDIYTHVFMLMALFNLFIIFQSNRFALKNSLLFVLFLACSILSKGPVSLYVLFLSFVIAYGIAYKFKGKPFLYFVKSLGLLILGIGFGALWYIYVRLEDPETFTKIAQKETSNWSSYNVRPFYYYWSFFIQSGLWTIPAFISLLYPYLKTRVVNLKAYRFSFFWTIIAVILLSIIPEKKSRYLMPVLIPLAINMGFYIDYLIREFKNIKLKKETFPVYLQFGLIAIIACLFWVSGFIFIENLNGIVLVRFIATSVILAFIGISIIKQLKKKNIKSVFYLTIGLLLSIGFITIPIVQNQKQSNYFPVSEYNSELPLYSFGYVAPEVIFNFGKKIPNIKTPNGIEFPSESQFGLLTSPLEKQSIDELSKSYTIEEQNTFDLNFSEKDKRGYKTRLVNTLYKLTLK